jgi:hypothetical protein
MTAIQISGAWKRDMALKGENGKLAGAFGLAVLTGQQPSRTSVNPWASWSARINSGGRTPGGFERLQ